VAPHSGPSPRREPDTFRALGPATALAIRREPISRPAWQPELANGTPRPVWACEGPWPPIDFGYTSIYQGLSHCPNPIARISPPVDAGTLRVPSSPNLLPAVLIDWPTKLIIAILGEALVNRKSSSQGARRSYPGWCLPSSSPAHPPPPFGKG